MTFLRLHGRQKSTTHTKTHKPEHLRAAESQKRDEKHRNRDKKEEKRSKYRKRHRKKICEPKTGNTFFSLFLFALFILFLAASKRCFFFLFRAFYICFRRFRFGSIRSVRLLLCIFFLLLCHSCFVHRRRRMRKFHIHKKYIIMIVAVEK